MEAVYSNHAGSSIFFKKIDVIIFFFFFSWHLKFFLTRFPPELLNKIDGVLIYQDRVEATGLE
jgi:hypothetical protein